MFAWLVVMNCPDATVYAVGPMQSTCLFGAISLNHASQYDIHSLNTTQASQKQQHGGRGTTKNIKQH